MAAPQLREPAIPSTNVAEAVTLKFMAVSLNCGLLGDGMSVRATLHEARKEQDSKFDGAPTSGRSQWLLLRRPNLTLRKQLALIQDPEAATHDSIGEKRDECFQVMHELLRRSAILPDRWSAESTIQLLERVSPTGRISEAQFEGAMRGHFIGTRGLAVVGSLKGSQGLVGDTVDSTLGSQLDSEFVRWMKLYELWAWSDMGSGAAGTSAVSPLVKPGDVGSGEIDVRLVLYAFHWLCGSLQWERFVLERALDSTEGGDRSSISLEALERVLLLPISDPDHRAMVADALARSLGEMRAAAGAVGIWRSMPARELLRLMTTGELGALFGHPVSEMLKDERRFAAFSRHDVHPSRILCRYEMLFSPVLRSAALQHKRVLLAEQRARNFLRRLVAVRVVMELRRWARIRRRARRVLSRLCDQWRGHAFRVFLVRWRRHAVEHQAATLVNALGRMIPRRIIFLRWRAARRLARMLDRAWRAFTARTTRRRYLAHRSRSARRIQAAWRGYRARVRLVTALTLVIVQDRMREARLAETERQTRAAVVIQTRVRGLLGRRAVQRERDFRKAYEQFRHAAHESAVVLEIERRSARIQVEDLVEIRRRERAEFDAALVRSAAIAAAQQARVLQRERRRAAEERQRRRDSAHKERIAQLVAFNREWDERIERDTTATREWWHELLFGARPSEGEVDRRATYDSSAASVLHRAREIVQERGGGLQSAVHAARNELRDQQVADKRDALVRVRKMQLERQTTAFRHQRQALEHEIEAEEAATLDAAARRLQRFIQRVPALRVARMLMRMEWRRGYDLESGAYYFYSGRSGTSQWTAPSLVSAASLRIEPRWEQRFSATGEPWFFFPPTHELRWSLPPDAAACSSCAAVLASVTCTSGCGLFCEACFTHCHTRLGYGAGHSSTPVDGGMVPVAVATVT